MPKPYSSDLRQRAIALVEAGRSRAAVARLLSIGKSTVILWIKDHRATGTRAALLNPTRIVSFANQAARRSRSCRGRPSSHALRAQASLGDPLKPGPP